MFYLKTTLVLVASLHLASCLFSIDVQRTVSPSELIDGTTNESLSSPAFVTKWIEQNLDHFDSNETRTFQMRYFQNYNEWAMGGPVFLFIGDVLTRYAFLQSGLMHELAVETNGAMFLSEHRYYGMNKPFTSTEVTKTENLKYLNSMQALKDLAVLVEEIKSRHEFRDSRVVVVGSFYGGTLAAWMRQSYPDLVDVAVASSAPVLAKANFFEYLETIGNIYKKNGSPECFHKITQIFKRYKNMLNNVNKIEAFKKEENICNDTDLNNEKNQQWFMLAKARALIPATLSEDRWPVMKTCKSLSTYLKPCDDVWNEKKQCCDYEVSYMVELIKQDDEELFWVYQQCTEFGFLTTTDTKRPFTDSIHRGLYYKVCRELFGPEFNGERLKDGVYKTNEEHGGLHPDVTKVVFVNGGFDPWHKLSVVKDLSPDVPAIFLPLDGRSRELNSVKDYTPEEVVIAREKVKHFVKKWIKK